MIKRWEPLIRQAKVDFWITGHDHDLQHIEFANHPTSFVISGGGGAELVDWTTPPEKRDGRPTPGVAAPIAPDRRVMMAVS